MLLYKQITTDLKNYKFFPKAILNLWVQLSLFYDMDQIISQLSFVAGLDNPDTECWYELHFLLLKSAIE